MFPRYTMLVYFQWLLSWLLYTCKWRMRLSVTNFTLENNLPTFWLNAPVVIRAKVKKCEQTLLFIAMHYWGYTSLEVKGLCGLLLPPCLLITVVQQPETSSPLSRLKHSSEGVIWMSSFTNSSCPLPRSSTVVSSSQSTSVHMLSYIEGANYIRSSFPRKCGSTFSVPEDLIFPILRVFSSFLQFVCVVQGWKAV